MKKFFALIMTLAMLSALAVPMVSADTLTSAGGSSGASYGGETIVPTISVDIIYPATTANQSVTTTKLVLNPYNKKLTSNTYAKIFEGSETAQVITSPMVLKSKSDSAIALVVSEAQATKSDTKISFLTRAPKSTATPTFDAYLYLVAESVSDREGQYPGEYVAANGLIFSDTKQANPKTVFTIEACESTNGTVAEADAKYAQLGIGGALATNIVENNVPLSWTAAHTIGVSYTLTITPSITSA